MTQDAIIALVRNFMDDLTPLSDQDNMVNTINPLIPAHLDYAALRLCEMIPANQQEVFAPTANLRVSPQSDHLLVTCPNDFLKLARVQLQGWAAPVNKVSKEGSNASQVQSFKYMKGTPVRPTAILMQRDADTYYLQLRPFSSSTVTVFYYVKKLLATEISDNLIDPLVYLTAARVYEAMRDTDNAKVCYDHVTQFIQSTSLKSDNP